jgi:hypothetical protein
MLVDRCYFDFRVLLLIVRYAVWSPNTNPHHHCMMIKLRTVNGLPVTKAYPLWTLYNDLMVCVLIIIPPCSNTYCQQSLIAITHPTLFDRNMEGSCWLPWHRSSIIRHAIYIASSSCKFALSLPIHSLPCKMMNKNDISLCSYWDMSLKILSPWRTDLCPFHTHILSTRTAVGFCCWPVIDLFNQVSDNL